MCDRGWDSAGQVRLEPGQRHAHGLEECIYVNTVTSSVCSLTPTSDEPCSVAVTVQLCFGGELQRGISSCVSVSLLRFSFHEVKITSHNLPNASTESNSAVYFCKLFTAKHGH